MKRMKNIILILTVISLQFSCNKKYDNPPANELPVGEIISIGDLKDMFTGSVTVIDSNYSIVGNITTEETNGAFYKEIYMEDLSGAIKIQLKASGGLYIGDSIRINVKDVTMSEYGDLIQLDNIDVDLQVVKIATEKFVEPFESSINQLSINEDQSRLVKLNDVEFTEMGMTYADAINLTTGSRILSDCNGNTIYVRTSGYANFADDTLPSGKGSVIGIFTIYNSEKQFVIRDINEVKLDSARCNGSSGGGGGSVVPVTSFNVDFQGFINYDDIEIDGWVNFNETGSRLWQAKEFNSNLYAQINAYSSTDISNTAWLVTPPIDFDINTNEVLQFQSAIAYYTHESFSLYYSSNFDGINVLSATWIEINGFNIAGSSSTNYVFESSGPIDLSSYSGIGYIAFKYEGEAGSGETGTFILDDIELSN